MKTVMNIAENNLTTVANAMQTAQIEPYVKPAIEVIEMQMEGVLCDSANQDGTYGIDYSDGGCY